MPVIRELVGRLEDPVIGPDGREMVRFHGILLGIPGVREGQFIQESLAEFTVRVTAPQGLAPADEKTIRDRARRPPWHGLRRTRHVSCIPVFRSSRRAPLHPVPCALADNRHEYKAEIILNPQGCQHFLIGLRQQYRRGHVNAV